MSDETYDFDGLIDQQAKIKEDHLRSSMNIAVGKNRGEQPKLFELGEKAQLPVDVVERNTQQVQQQVDYEANKYDDLINNYPAISEYLGDPNRAALVYDDVSVLTDISDYVRSGGAGVVSIGGAVKGIADLSTALGSKMVSLLPEDAENAVREFDKSFTDATDAVNPISVARRAGQSFNNLAEMMRPPAERRSFGTDVAEGLGQLAGQVGLTLLTGGAAGSVAFAGMGADQMEQEAVREGASQADKDNAIIYGSMITAASEKLGVDRLLNRLPPAVKNKILSRITDIMIGGGIEASQEAAENILFNFAEQITFDEDQELVEGVGHSSSVGGAVGSIARAITMGASKKLRDVERNRQQAEVAEQNVNQIKGLFEKVESAAVSETAPAEAEKLFQSIMDENGIDTFTFEPTEFASAIEENGADLQEITDRLGITDQFNVALANGDQIDIPAGKVMAEFANNDLQDAILGSYRSSEETMTLNDSQAMMEMLEQETKQAYEDAGLEADEVLQMETKADEVYDAVASEMLKGDVESEVGQRHPVAELYRAFALRQMADWKAEGKDFDPFDFYEKLGLTFSNEKGEPVPAKQKVRDLRVSAQLNDLRKRGPKNEMLPLFNFIKDNGRVKTGSKLAAELQAIGITPKTNVGLFSGTGDFGDADNIVASEFNEQFGVVAEEDDNGYVDRNWLLEKISDGSFGQNEQDDLDILEDQINKAGIDINQDNDSIIQELFADERDAMYQSDISLPNLEKSSTGPIPAVIEMAIKYNKQIGNTHRRQAEYVKVDVEFAEKIAQAYEDMDDDPNDPAVKAAYDLMIDETIAQFHVIQDAGMKFEFITADMDDPYSEGPKMAIEDMRDNNHLWVFPTEGGFGTINEADADNPLLRETDIVIDGHKLLANDVFRIVHDVFGHGLEGARFGPRGEENAWQAHVRMYSLEAARAMTTETRGQNSWLNFGPYGEANRTNPKETVYADQKIGLLPLWATTGNMAADQETTDDGRVVRGRDSSESSQRAENEEAQGTEGKAFKEWFGNSKVVNDAGEPLVVYHGGFGIKNIARFEREYGGQTTGNNEHGAFHFTDNREVAEDYGRQSFNRRFQDSPEMMADEVVLPEGMTYDEDQGMFIDQDGVTFEPYDLVEELAEDNIETQSVFLKIENPYTLDMNNKQVDVQQIEELSAAFMAMGDGDFSKIPEEAMETVYEMAAFNADDVADNKEEIETKVLEDNDLEDISDAEDWQVQEATREYMEENGYEEEFTEFDGIIITNMIDDIGDMSKQIADQYIVFDPTNIKSVDNVGTFNANDDRILHQTDRGFIKGNFGDINSKFEIVTLKDANMSTLLHETGHLFLEMMNREAQMDGAPQRVQDNMAATLEYLGVDSFDKIETEHHEKFARSFEVYLRTGKAPTIRLRRAFDKFKAWLVQVYETLRGNYDIEMTADVQNVFNTLLATEEEILEAEEQTGFEMSAELTELMNEEEQAEYRRNAEDTHSEAYNKALALKIREEQRDQTKAWRENRKRVEGEVTRELYKEPIYQVWNLIKKGEFFEQDTPDHLKGQRLNKQSLIDVFGSEGVLKELPHGMYSVDGGIDVEYLADRMGYETSNALLEDLVNAEKPADAIQARTDQRMEIEYPKVGVAEIALKAVQNNRQSIFLETELKVLRKKNKNDDTRYNIDVIREAVDRAIETMPIKQVMGKARTYLANSRRAGKTAERALIAKDYELAMEEKRKQLLNYEMFRAISDAKGKTDKMKSRLFKLANRKINPKTMKPEYIERIKDLLYSYSFAEVNKPREARRAIEALEKFVLEQNQNATDEGRVQIQVSPRLMEASDVTDWRDLTFDQLSNLDDAAKTLAHIGRNESKEEQEAHASLVNEIGLSIEDNVRVRKKWGTIADQNTVKAGFWNSIAPAYLRRLPSYINELDGFGFDGPMAKAILQPLEEATVKFESILDPIRKRVSENQKKSYNFKELMALKRKNIFIDQLQEKITKENLLALAHNWGNQGNRDAIMNGVFKGLSEADVENIFKDHMTKKDWDYVQENLDIVNSLWPEISELQRRQTGTTPPKVEATVIKTEFGEYAGGYYPLKYSPINSAVANQKAREAATNAPVIGMAATVTKHGHTEERVAGHGFPVEMSMDVMYNHLGSVIHDLAYREAIQSAAKVMRSKPVSEAIIKTKGPQAYEVMQLILSSQAVGDGGQIKGWEKASKHLRLNFAIAVIGLNMRSILTQPTGMLQAFVSNKVGFGYMAKALAQFTAGGLNMRANIKEIHDKSPYMARRSKVFRNELREQSNKIGASGLKDNMVAASFYPMIKLDSMIAGIVWNGAYNKAQDQGFDEEQSIRFADRMVRDTQASGEQYQLSGLTNTGEFGKMLTIFGSYFSATYNLTAESFNQARNGADAKSWATFGMDMILLHGAQGILAALMLEHWPDDEDEWGMWTLQALASQVFGMVPVASSAYRSVMSGFGVNSLPADAVINTTLQAGQSIAKDIENGELSEGTVKSMARSASYLAGIPAVNGIIRAYDVLEENEDASLLDVLLRPKQK